LRKGKKKLDISSELRFDGDVCQRACK